MPYLGTIWKYQDLNFLPSIVVTRCACHMVWPALHLAMPHKGPILSPICSGGAYSPPDHTLRKHFMTLLSLHPIETSGGLDWTINQTSQLCPSQVLHVIKFSNSFIFQDQFFLYSHLLWNCSKFSQPLFSLPPVLYIILPGSFRGIIW